MDDTAPFKDIINVLESAKVEYWDVLDFGVIGSILWYSPDGVGMVCVQEHDAKGITGDKLAELEMVLTFGCHCN
jgi:hypothetical protein